MAFAAVASAVLGVGLAAFCSPSAWAAGGGSSDAPGGLSQVQVACDPDAGGTYPWEASTSSGTNTGHGNKMTSLGITGWSAKGGLPVSLSLFHNSQGTSTSSELGPKWTHSYDIYLIVDPQTGVATIHWGDALAYPFAIDAFSGLYEAPPGIRDVLDPSQTGYTLTTKSGVVYAFSHGAGNRWKCDSITDRNGNAVTLTHNSGDFVTAVTDASGRALSFTYNAANQLTSVSDPSVRSWSFSYSGAGDLAQVAFPSAVPASGQNPLNSFTYNASHNIVDWTDARSKHWLFGYASNGSLLWEKNPLGIQTATYTYSTAYTRITDGRGFVTEYLYQNGLLTGVKNALGVTETYGYDADNNKTSLVDRAGHSWTYTYDAWGNILTQTDPLSHTTTYTYNALNKPLSVTTPAGRQTTSTYDAYGNALSVTNPLGQTTTLAYDSAGQVTSATDALNHTTTFGYNVYGDQTSVTDATGRSVSAVFDVMGRKVSATDASGLTTTYSYDGRGLNTGITAPGNRTTIFAYDLGGLKTSQTNALGQTNSLTYDEVGQVISHTDGLGRVVSLTYDDAGNRAQLTDGLGHITSYAYDGRGLLTGITYPDNTGELDTYDSAGRLQTKTDGRGVVQTRTYSAANQLTGVSYSDGTPGVNAAYDVNNRQISMSDGSGTTTYTYDNANRLTGRTSPQGSVSYSYDAAGRMVSLTANGATTTYSYDNAGRLMSAMAPNGTTGYGYDTAGRLVTTNFANGATETKTYDSSSGDLTDIWTVGAGAATLTRQSYQYDGLGRKAVETLASGATRVFGYDAAGQLTSETKNGANGYTTTYSYDAAGNRASKTQNGAAETYAYDAANKLQTVGGVTSKTYSYDGAGNVTAVTSGAGTTNLTWDGAGRVSAIAFPNGNSNAFAYNGLSQRVGKLDSGGQFGYTLAGDAIDTPVLSDGQAAYQYGNGLISEVRGGVSKIYHADTLGTTRAMSGASGTTTDTLETDAFGNTVSSAGTSPSPFGFAGQFGYQTDADSGLMQLGYRYYDASVGRFISRDPIRAGYNWYTYCDNDPVNAVDPEGLQELEKRQEAKDVPITLGGSGTGYTGEPIIIESPYHPKPKNPHIGDVEFVPDPGKGGFKPTLPPLMWPGFPPIPISDLLPIIPIPGAGIGGSPFGGDPRIIPPQSPLPFTPITIGGGGFKFGVNPREGERAFKAIGKFQF